MSRTTLTQANHTGVQHYAVSTRQQVDQIAAALEQLFWLQRSGQASKPWAKQLERLFALWCSQSGIVTSSRAQRALAPLTAASPSLAETRRVVHDDLGFGGESVDTAIDSYVASLRSSPSKAARKRAEAAMLKQLYEGPARALCLESAHVSLARMVLYRILEDRGLAQQRLSGTALKTVLAAAAKQLVGATSTPAVTLVEDMRRDTEDFLPLLFGLRELDWWQIPTVPSSAAQAQLFHQQLGPVEVALQSTLQLLDQYDFSQVDRDVWRDVYEQHLPPTDRQRLGSFYTPDSMVDLALDLAGWTVKGARPIDQEVIADISCGSGAFLVQALRRRRQAMEQRPANKLGKDPEPAQLNELMEGIVGFDVHPFATFLASVNLVFQVIDLYTSVRHRHPTYSLPLNIFTADSLEDRGVGGAQQSLRKGIPNDIRVRHTQEEIARYRQLRKQKFDVVVGNPPWGGMLKGKLSPLFDPERREQYRSGGVFSSATGKYDIYVLFIERCIGWLRHGGRYGLVVPNTFRDKDFGRGIRQFLISGALPDHIVDFGPYGQTFFRAMNTPSVISGSHGPPAQEMEVVLVGKAPFNAQPDPLSGRQSELVQRARQALAGSPPAETFVFKEPVSEVKSWGGGHWPLHPLRALRTPVEKAGDYSCGQLLEPKQGATPGGQGVLERLQMDPAEARRLGLEAAVLHSAIKGLDVQPWHTPTPPLQMLYPYLLDSSGKTVRAFLRPDGKDSLDLQPRDQAERQVVAGLNDAQARERLLTHRIAAGGCSQPNAAKYLVELYDLLAARRPKGKPLSSMGREWYEYLWPREADHMLAKPKIVSPRLTRWPRFALDEDGVLPTDSCIAMWRPGSVAGRGKLADLQRELEAACARKITEREVLIYILAFLNSSASALLMRIGREPSPKGSWTVDEDYLTRVRLVVPSGPGQAAGLLGKANDCITESRKGTLSAKTASALDSMVLDALALDPAVRAQIDAWSTKTRASV